ncbi:MAG: cytochrome c-type biogenesis protein CcmH [Candidatus Rokubacteria bacterium]|nr:cytochrome c-type biogenesis protein CcmH [Candidatus Rokubacteria bacterium]
MTRLIVVAAWLVIASAQTSVGQQAVPINDREAYEIALQLRCVVCQNLSVADSPSEMAQQMRAIVRERLAMGERPEQVIQYFVDRYGEWILLAPRRRGFTLLVWLFPIVAVAVGLAVTGLVVARWRRRAEAQRRPADLTIDPAIRERIRRELEAEDG